MQAASALDSPYRLSRGRNILTGLCLLLATAMFCLWQNSRIAALFDLSYLLDTSWRMAQGQMPYRDFPFAHAPGTFLLHGVLIRLIGRVYWPHILCAAAESGMVTLLTWRLLLRLLPAAGESRWWTALLFAATLVPLGIYSIYPHPIYDGDAIFAVSVAIYMFFRAAEFWGDESTPAARARALNFFAGGACVVPVLFKQNIGLAFAGVVLLGVTAVFAARMATGKSIASEAWFLSGSLSAILLALAAIHFTVGLGAYVYWTITFAAQRRLPGISTPLGVYHQTSLLWSVPAAIAGVALLHAWHGRRLPRIFAFLLLAGPFLWTMAALLLDSDTDDRADQLLSLWPHLLVLAALFALLQLWRMAHAHASAAEALLPLLLLAAIHGAFLSQQLWGSTYALWPLLILLIGLLLTQVRQIALPLALTISSTLVICGTLYAASLERLDYVRHDGPETHAALPALRGMATPGPWLPEFEGMVRATDAEITQDEGIVLIPGEEPFYFASGRIPQFPVLLTDLATDPYTPEHTAAEMRARNIRWLIVKRDLQLAAPPGYETPELLRTVEQDFGLVRSIPGYDIYRRR